MPPTHESPLRPLPPGLSVEAVRLAAHVAQCECVCELHLAVCLLTDTGERASLQPFLYEPHGAA